mmetsp:Transcript_1519/g.4083  ORF Transcript_1519/g.4083 Transcript_1519/m.4083 type:complete len:213 (+) Transcript_1519:57-695(+)|eukprot:CAMPEP_0184710258 /NCGR_PEP_ID=MMETSP0314-20130426/1136_1 /TAXON_ID=38298 /ORGANISM="Rhodella maculata, Strain CCMP 736" /LENGTH=212 /DNA_ID=CAMNT_0027172071 /DNA_START=43 /DNA_END=681 /DNA_ORIENTATION=-
MPYWGSSSSSSSDEEDDYNYSLAPSCAACNRTFTNTRALDQHNAALHSFPCASCPKNFVTSRARDQHTNSVRAHQCQECLRVFSNANNLKQHAQTHRIKATPCPGCGQKYRGWTDAALHFETGFCPGCPGRGAARKKMYDFVSTADPSICKAPLMIGYRGRMEGGYDEEGSNYVCKGCHRDFKAMGSLLQHCDARPQCQRGNGGSSRLGLGM